MMFSKSPLEKACANRDRLLADVTKAEKQVAAKSEAVDSTYDDADASEDARTKVRAAKRDAEEALKASKAALARAETLIVKIKQAQADDDLKARQQASAAKILQDHVPRLTKGIKMYVEGAAIIAEVTTEMLPYTPDARRLQLITSNAALETPEHGDLLIAVAKSVAQSIAAGGPPLAEHAPPPVALPQPATVAGVFTADTIRWTDANGDLMTEHRWWETYLPPAIADHAIAIGAAVPFGHDLHRKQKGWGKNTAKLKPEDCRFNLDDPDVPIDAAPIADKTKPSASVHPLQPPEMHSAFEKPVIGPRVDFKVPRGEPSLANATRNLPTSEGDK